jgi:hypothetical protein
MTKKIKIPDKTQFHLWSDSHAYFEDPGEGSIELYEAEEGALVGDGMLYENGTYMLYEDGTYMIYE